MTTDELDAILSNARNAYRAVRGENPTHLIVNWSTMDMLRHFLDERHGFTPPGRTSDRNARYKGALVSAINSGAQETHIEFAGTGDAVPVTVSQCSVLVWRPIAEALDHVRRGEMVLGHREGWERPLACQLSFIDEDGPHWRSTEKQNLDGGYMPAFPTMFALWPSGPEEG